MLLLNIADIHFKHPLCNSDMDADRPFRTELIRDARDRVTDLGAIDAILVGGDIAFAGKKEEYAAAYTWLNELADACECPLTRVFVVPGNHDVNRATATQASVKNVHKAIKNAGDDHRELELSQQFHDAEAGRNLLKTLDEYNEFAARFECQVWSPERLFWTQTLDLNSEVKLRIFGLTSTILSGIDGKNDQRLGLYLSPLQTVLDPVDGVVNAILCHHPPDWCMDIDEIEDAICGRASLQFFGHKHRQRVHRDYNFIRFSAGAVNPDRREGAWEPGYNIIKLDVVERDGAKFLDIEGHLLVWQTNPDMFRPKKLSPTDEILKHRLPIRWPRVRARRNQLTPSTTNADTNTTTPVCPADKAVEMEEVMSTENTRNLVLRFWDLSQSDRREITLNLGLITEHDIAIPEPERYGRALQKACEQGLLERLAEEIQKRPGE